MEIELVYFNHNCNSYLLINNQDCLLVDPGFNHNECLTNYIKSKGLTLKAVLLTHAHYDHIEGLLNIKNVPVYLYKGEEKALTNERYNCSFMSFNSFIVENVNYINVSDNEELNLIGITIKVIHTPFHTSGSVCYYIKEKKAVLTGDTLFLHAIGRSDLPTSETRKTRDSLNKLFKLPHEVDNDTIVYPGHGGKTTLSREYRFLKKEYLE